MTEPTMQITLTVPVNADNASIAAALRMRAGIFEGMTAKTAASRKNTDPMTDDDDDTDGEEIAETPTKTKTKKTTKKAAASFDDDDDTDEETTDEETEIEAASDDEDEDFTTPPKKTSKAKKISVADVNDACKARAKAGGKQGREQVLKILKKNFKTESISEIKPDQYAAVIKAMAV